MKLYSYGSDKVLGSSVVSLAHGTLNSRPRNGAMLCVMGAIDEILATIRRLPLQDRLRLIERARKRSSRGHEERLDNQYQLLT